MTLTFFIYKNADFWGSFIFPIFYPNAPVVSKYSKQCNVQIEISAGRGRQNDLWWCTLPMRLFRTLQYTVFFCTQRVWDIALWPQQSKASQKTPKNVFANLIQTTFSTAKLFIVPIFWDYETIFDPKIAEYCPDKTRQYWADKTGT